MTEFVLKHSSNHFCRRRRKKYPKVIRFRQILLQSTNGSTPIATNRDALSYFMLREYTLDDTNQKSRPNQFWLIKAVTSGQMEQYVL